MVKDLHTPSSADLGPAYLTTKEVADLLRVKERKVYDLAAAGDIPHRRITGKLLFPAEEIRGWIEGSQDLQRERPPVLSGSHDPLLDWALRESGSTLSTLWNGSREGLARFASGDVSMSGLHVPEANGWNIETVGGFGLRDAVMVSWAKRSRGLLLAPALAGAVRTFGDLRGKRIALRQPGAGAALLFDRLLEKAGIALSDLEPLNTLARTESDAAAAVADGDADASLGIEAMARQYQLAFLPLQEERFDLLIDRRAYFTEPVQDVISFAQTPVFKSKAQAMSGYDVSDVGTVRWLSQ